MDQSDEDFVDNKWKYWQSIYNLDDLRVSSIFSNYHIPHFDRAFPSGKSNLMASSADGKFIFLAVVDCINVYESPEFSTMNPPDPSSFFPFNPVKKLRPSPQLYRKILSRVDADYRSTLIINHIRSGWIGEQESLVAVGEIGVCLVWNLGNLDEEPILMENSDLASTWGVAMSPKNYLLATSSNSHAVTIYHYPSKRIIFSAEQQKASNKDSRFESVPIHTHNIPSLDFSPCGKFLVSCSIDSYVVLWSLIDGSVRRMLSPSREWGWLVRFVPSRNYDLRSVNDDGKYTKTYYHSKVKELPLNYSDEEDITAPYYMGNLMESEMSNDQFDAEDFDSEDVTENEEISDEDEIINAVYDANISAISGEVHLAEGAGDTWPSEFEDDDEIVDNRQFSDYSDGSDVDFFSDTGEDYTDDDSPVYCSDTDYNDEFESETLLIKLQNIDGICLFKTPSTPPIPFDIFYSTAESLFILDSSSGKVKLTARKLKKKCLEKQKDVTFLEEYPFGMQFLQHRLAMGEWIDELGLFILIDCNGHLFVSSPKLANALEIESTLIIPDTIHSYSQIIGYTVIRRDDEEFGLKLHLYIICENGTFKLYEIVKK